jgi:hypothetical protein
VGLVANSTGKEVRSLEYYQEGFYHSKHDFSFKTEHMFFIIIFTKELWDRLRTLFRMMRGYGLPAPVAPWSNRQDRQVKVRYYKPDECLQLAEVTAPIKNGG